MFEVGIIINSSHFSYCLREEKSKNFTKFRAQVYKKKIMMMQHLVEHSAEYLAQVQFLQDKRR